MDGTLTATLFDRARLERAADLLAVAVVVSMPWSTTATSVLLVLWLVAVVPTLDWPAVRRELFTAPGGLPVLFSLLGVVGMLWADVPWRERLGGLDSFHRILFIPLPLAQFRRSGNGRWVMVGFLTCWPGAACSASSLRVFWSGRSPGFLPLTCASASCRPNARCISMRPRTRTPRRASVWNFGRNRCVSSPPPR